MLASSTPWKIPMKSSLWRNDVGPSVKSSKTTRREKKGTGHIHDAASIVREARMLVKPLCKGIPLGVAIGGGKAEEEERQELQEGRRRRRVCQGMRKKGQKRGRE